MTPGKNTTDLYQYGRTGGKGGAEEPEYSVSALTLRIGEEKTC